MSVRALCMAAIAILAWGCDREEPKPAPTPPAPESAPSAAVATPAAEAMPQAATTSADAGATSGATLYKTYCETCHGPSGAGDGPAATGLTPKPANFVTRAFRLDANNNGTKGDIDDIQAVIRDGAAKYGGSPLMAPWPALNDEQRRAVADHILSLAQR